MAWLLLPPAAGAALPVQFAVNTHLRDFVGGPVAAAASFVVGTIALAMATLAVQRSLPDYGSIAGTP